MQQDNSKKGILYGIGIGPGDPDLLTIKAVKILEKADVICVPKSKEQASTALAIVSKYLKDTAVVEPMVFSMSKDIEKRIESRKENARLIEQKLDDGQIVVFLTLGDPMLYSTYSYVLEHLKTGCLIETIPGIYSFSAISSLLSLPLVKGDDKLAVISSWDEGALKMIESADTVVCMKISSFHTDLYAFLKESKDYNFVMITNAGKDTQEVFHSREVLREKVPYFSTAIIQKQKTLQPKILASCQM
ncbi:precorrin-2 C(20)-methyltransferase [Labilibacter sediminis]|nr:precorrin-2 C(20)-methyltransferase [Labilibacter sediminis]